MSSTLPLRVKGSFFRDLPERMGFRRADAMYALDLGSTLVQDAGI